MYNPLELGMLSDRPSARCRPGRTRRRGTHFHRIGGLGNHVGAFLSVSSSTWSLRSSGAALRPTLPRCRKGVLWLLPLVAAPRGLRHLLRPDLVEPVLWVIHRFTLLHVHMGGGGDDPTCRVATQCPCPCSSPATVSLMR
ncbi:uncharacterized protein LOC123404244 [Hordeum vulgare subsp. vulgare]|uniref:uncharacterized protein LOC123404244 n=1 Tax=Hordeum vulgare subsp. vulgare TaxID=112509 RepID=UPI000B470C33|nr:uncharacterized protein LOC123404244 [Hordeum vulgare subsp. vulgare]